MNGQSPRKRFRAGGIVRRVFAIAGEAGLSLIAVLFWLLILSALVFFLSLRAASHAVATGDVERQLYSLVLAANGIEYARGILPAADLNELLLGFDGVREDSGAEEARNPMTLAEARRLMPGTWAPVNDDGLPWAETGPLLPHGYEAVNEGQFFLRFSNNPEESAVDEDGIVIARSMGVARSRYVHPFMPDLRNSISLVEARFRQEKLFDVPGPLTLFGDSGEFTWEGDGFAVDGLDRTAVSMVMTAGSTLLTDWNDSLLPAQLALFQGGGVFPSVQDATDAFEADPAKRVVFEGQFWRHFLAQVPAFVERLEGIVYLPSGGWIDRTHEGIVLARGDLTVADARIDGLLIHLGGGRLRLLGETSVNGGLWISNVEDPMTMDTGPVRLGVSDTVRITFDRERIRRALSRFPVTQLGWRIIFPEMEQ